MKMPLFNPDRPPSGWMKKCKKSVSKKTRTPGKLCGWVWYHGTSKKAKKAAVKKYEAKKNPSRSKIYVGVKNGKYVVFKSVYQPTRKSHGSKFSYVIGPFNTIRAAEYMAKYGRGNPHLQTVADAERLSKNK